MSIDPPDADQAVAAVLARIGAAWPERRYADLADCFESDMVIVAPDGTRIAGRNACVASYRAFADQAVITGYRETPPQIDLLGDTAVAIVPWQIAWQDTEGEHRETGRDLFVLTRRSGRWRAVWRMVLSA